MARAGFDPDELQDIQGGDLEEAAVSFADKYHQIDEETDMNFEVYVEDGLGELHIFKMKTEWNPTYYVESSNVSPNK